VAKTISQIISDARQIIAQPVEANSNFTDVQLTAWANDAYRKIVIALRVLPVTQNDYTITAQEVTINSATLTIDQALIYNPDSGKYESLAIKTLDELIQTDPDYENADTNVPQWMIRKSVTSVLLYPPPKASVIAQTTPLRTFGLELPAELSVSNTTPRIPENLHDIICNYIAFRCFQFLNDEPRATQQLTIFRGSLKDQKGVSGEFSRQAKRWRFEGIQG
jgi:hypothetical protein